MRSAQQKIGDDVLCWSHKLLALPARIEEIKTLIVFLLL